MVSRRRTETEHSGGVGFFFFGRVETGSDWSDGVSQ